MNPPSAPHAAAPHVTGSQNADPRAELLAQMHDLAAPAGSSFWPPAPLWWLLAFALLGLLVWAFVFVRQRLRANRYRRLALREYQALMKNKDSASDEWLCQQLTRLLKRTFFAAYPQSRHRVAGIYGKAWLELLDLTAKQPLHAQQFETTLTRLLYSNTKADRSTLLLDDFARFTEKWIKQHKRWSPALGRNLTESIARSEHNTRGQHV